MCGIVGYVGAQQAAPILLEGLQKLEYRGYDSAGIAVLDGSTIELAKACGEIKNLLAKTHDGSDLHGYIGLAHTRWATHGAPTEANAHPHVSNDGKFAIVQNGIIENFMELREMLQAKGFRFHSETDTEVIVHLLDMYYTGDGNLKDTVLKTLGRLEGSYAIGILCADCPEQMFLARNGCPLIIGVGAGENFFASDVTALVSHTKNVVYLDDGELAEVRADGYTVFDCTGKPVHKPVSRVAWDIEAAEKGGYEHFMMKEIYEQPAAVRDTISPRLKDGQIDLSELALDEEAIRNVHRLYIIGCGSAYHVGMAARYVFESLARIPVEVDVASEFRYRNPVLEKDALAMVISQSGETADTLAALRLCKERGVRNIGIVNVVGSSIAREADATMYTWAGPEISVATTKAYSTQLAACYLLATEFARVRGTLADGQYEHLVTELEALPEKIEKTLADKERIQWFASKYANAKDAFFIGRGLDYAVALEGSLKFKEISYIHSEAFAAGEMKHGPISLVEKGTLVVGILTQPDLYEKSVSNMVEVKSRGAFLMGLTTYGNYSIEDTAGFTVYVPKTDPHFATSLSVIPLQLLAYYVSCAKGLDVDKPRNLAKSVTVE